MNNNINNNILVDDNGLIRSKFLNLFFPLLLMNVFLAISTHVNSIVIGHYIGKEAFAAVNLFQPITNFIAALMGFLSGIWFLIPNTIGENDVKKRMLVLKSSIIFAFIIMILIAIVQIPFAHWLAEKYEEKDLILIYVLPYYYINVLVTISTLGTNILLAHGETKSLLYLTIIEAITNVIFDFIFVAGLKLGIIGAAYGTLVSTIVRVILTIWKVNKLMNILDILSFKARISEITNTIIEIIRYGFPITLLYITLTFQTYYLNEIFISNFGSEGIIVNSVNMFILNLSIMFFSAVASAATPIACIFKSANDHKRLYRCMKMVIRLMVVIGLVFIVTSIMFNEVFYRICGIIDIPYYAKISIILFSIIFIPRGINTATRMFVTMERKTILVSLMIICQMSILPLIFALILCHIKPTLVFMTYALSDCVIAIFSCLYCKFIIDKQNDLDKKIISLTLSLDKENLSETSSYVIEYLKDNGVSDKVAYKAGLAIEEMYKYIPDNGRETKNIVFIYIEDGDVIFHMIHDGVDMHLDKLKETPKYNVIYDNYELVNALANKFEYQYIMSLSNITIRFNN